MAVRYDCEETIVMLQKEYPAVFFEQPQQRKPLKLEIFEDLVNDGFAVERNLLKAAVDWYTGHYGYQHALRAGAKRIDLQGRDVGTVTVAEQAAAQREIRRIGEMRKISHHQPANKPSERSPMLPKPAMPPEQPATSDRAPELAPLYEALEAANSYFLGGASNEALRSAMLAAALNVLIEETRRVITNCERAA
jgi:ProP effector